MKEKDPELIAKLHCLRTLFPEATEQSPFLIQQLRDAIETAISGEAESPAPFSMFATKAVELWRHRKKLPPSFGFQHLDLAGRVEDPLWLYQDATNALKALAGYRNSMLLVSGLPFHVPTGASGKGSKRTIERAAEARRYIDAIALRFSSPGSCITIMYV